MERNRIYVDMVLWCAVAYLVTHVPCIEMRVDDIDQPAPRKQPPASTARPEPIEQHLNIDKCFHMPRSMCPTKAVCTTLGPGNMSVFCCDMDNNYMKETLPSIIMQNKTHLHVLNASVDELDVSQSIFRRLTSMAFTDGNIGKIIGQFPKHSPIACLNISNNNLTTAKLPNFRRAFAYLSNFTVLDASANNLTDFPFNLPSNRKIQVALSGNNYISCKHFQRAMDSNSNAEMVEFINENNTFCALDLSFNWFNDVQIVPINHVKKQKALNASCQNIKPENISCSCVPERLEVLGNNVTILVAVDCSRRQLKVLPTNLPNNTVKLDVSYNNITSLQPIADDHTYNNLKQLFIEHNELSDIKELEGTKFIDQFLFFSIGYNKLTTITTYLLSNSFATTGPILSIAGNSIHCDCNTEKTLKPWLLENSKNIPDYSNLLCNDNMGAVMELVESRVCHTPRDWTDYIYYIIGLEVLVLVLLISKVSYDYWVFKSAGYLPWPANKMPRLPCDWLCE